MHGHAQQHKLSFVPRELAKLCTRKQHNPKETTLKRETQREQKERGRELSRGREAILGKQMAYSLEEEATMNVTAVTLEDHAPGRHCTAWHLPSQR